MKGQAYTPQFSGAVEKMVSKMAYKYFWRTQPDFGPDDLIQEGFLLFVEITERYKIENERHLQTLMCRSFFNRIHRLSNTRTRRQKHVLTTESCLEDLNIAAASDNLSTLCLSDIPEQFAQLAELAIRGQLPSRRVRPADHPEGMRETTVQYASRLLGTKATPEILSQLKQFLTGENTPCTA
jgi:hypothetical protein